VLVAVHQVWRRLRALGTDVNNCGSCGNVPAAGRLGRNLQQRRVLSLRQSAEQVQRRLRELRHQRRALW
jgi:hypothetical protein